MPETARSRHLSGCQRRADGSHHDPSDGNSLSNGDDRRPSPPPSTAVVRQSFAACCFLADTYGAQETVRGWERRSNAYGDLGTFPQDMQRVMAALGAESESRGLRVFHRTTCLVAAMHETSCRLHHSLAIDEIGLSLATELGYEASPPYDLVTTETAVELGSQSLPLSLGDVNLVRILTGVRVLHGNPASTNVLSFLKTESGRSLDCSSSWFTYTRSTPCRIGCFYCEVNYRAHPWGEIGCVPIQLSEHLPPSRRDSNRGAYVLMRAASVHN